MPTSVDRLRLNLTEVREALGAARARLAEAAATQLGARLTQAPEQPVVAVLEGATAEELRSVAARLTSAHPQAVLLLAAPASEGLSVLITRGAHATFGCGAFLKRAAEAAGGRGGGRPEHAEGRLPPQTDWPALVRPLLG